MAAHVSVRALLAEQGENFRLRLLTGENGLDHYINDPRVQKPSLAFVGFMLNISDYSLQVIGETELAFLATLSEAEQRKVVVDLFAIGLAAVVITNKQHVPDIILQTARQSETPLMVSEHRSSRFMVEAMSWLAHRLAAKESVHGVYLDVHGLGVLLLGDSGVGKSEIALELISRGHRLVADDMVDLYCEAPDILVGRCPDLLRDCLEVRGQGILNIRRLFGASSIALSKRVGLVVRLLPWQQLEQEPRLPESDQYISLHSVRVPLLQLPVRPGRSLATMIEVATVNQALKNRGIDGQQDFIQRLDQKLSV